ncbi:unnamed protein product [marine sediment metagenome]|uniref:Uncharacterized protein n=1 Tax=marine sediment metagenome TaxID=412755 RepID=X1A5M7_9ZZZZ
MNEKELLDWLDFHYEPLYSGQREYDKIVQIIKLHFSDDWQQVKKDLGKFMKEQDEKNKI